MLMKLQEMKYNSMTQKIFFTIIYYIMQKNTTLCLYIKLNIILRILEMLSSTNYGSYKEEWVVDTCTSLDL